MNPDDHNPNGGLADAESAEAKSGVKKRSGKSHPTVVQVQADPAQDLEWQKQFFSNHRLRTAQIPRRFWNKTLKNFETKDALRRTLVRDAQNFIKGFNFENEFPQGLLMVGEVGCGKSHLAVAILREVIEKGYTGLYYNSPDLLRDIRATFHDDAEITEDDLLQEINEVDLLVLDDLGAEKVSDFVLDRFYLIVNKRYEGCKPMIITTNLTDEETLRNRLGDRIMSRFCEMCQFFKQFPREDFRRRKMLE